MKDLFNKVFKEKGNAMEKTIAGTAFIEYSNKIIEDTKKLYPTLPKIYCDMIDSTIIGASAGMDGNNFFIGVNAGLAAFLDDFYILANSTSNDSTVKLPLEQIDRTKPHLRMYDRKRDGYAIGMSNNMYVQSSEQFSITHRFFIYHELGHIARGHVGLISGTECTFLDENLNNISDSQINIRQTLEVDADHFAVTGIIRDYLEKKISSADHKSEVSIYRDWAIFVHQFSYSIYIFFRLFGLKSLDITKDKKANHPINLVRLDFIIDHMFSYMQMMNISNIDGLRIMFQNAVEKAENDFVNVTYHSNELSRIREIFTTPEFINYKQSIFENWNIIRPKLEKYTFIEFLN